MSLNRDIVLDSGSVIILDHVSVFVVAKCKVLGVLDSILPKLSGSAKRVRLTPDKTAHRHAFTYKIEDSSPTHFILYLNGTFQLKL